MEFTDHCWFDENHKPHAKDCPACGGSGDYYVPNDAAGLRYTCDTCHGSGIVPADDCPEQVAKLIRDSNQRLVFEADQDWDEGGSDYEGQECPVCGYDLDRNGECTGNGCGADLCS